MIENKLGLKIIRTSQGYGDGLEVNGGQQWTKSVRDVREDLKNIENLDGKSSVLMLTCLDDGNLITIASLIDGRITDCISAWIFVPANLMIKGRDLEEVVNATRNEIMAVERNDNVLRSVFAKEYATASAKFSSKKSVGEGYAYRYYGVGCDYTLRELLDYINQPQYHRYKSVFFIEKASGLACSAGADLSGQRLQKSFLAQAPSSVDGFVPYTNGKKFDTPMYVTEGESVEIEWRREGYEPIVTVTVLKQGGGYVLPMPNQYKRLIPYDSVRVIDEWNQPVKNYTLKINGRVVGPGENASVSIAVINSLRIEVCAEGYEPVSMSVDYTRGEKMRVRLAKAVYEYKFAIPRKGGGAYMEFRCTSEERLRESPIEGYVPDNGSVSREKVTKLRYKPHAGGFRISAAIVLGVVFLLGMGLGGWLWDCLRPSDAKIDTVVVQSRGDVKTETPVVKESDGQEPDEGAEASIGITAAEFLDKNNVWKRSELENFEETKGLWDALNERRYDDILKYEAKLKASTKFSNVMAAVKRNRFKGQLGKYTDAGKDEAITVSTYIDKLDNARIPETQNVNPREKSNVNTEPAESKEDEGSSQNNWM